MTASPFEGQQAAAAPQDGATDNTRNIVATGGAGEARLRGTHAGKLERAERASQPLLARPPTPAAGFIASWVVIKLVQQHPQCKARRTGVVAPPLGRLSPPIGSWGPIMWDGMRVRAPRGWGRRRRRPTPAGLPLLRGKLHLAAHTPPARLCRWWCWTSWTTAQP